MKRKTTEKAPDRDRRQFIKLTTAGTLGGLTACAAPQVEKPSAPPVTPEDGPDRGLSDKKPVAPEVGDLVDPYRLEADTWQEPWTWRPEEWPGEPLELNVVASQNPGRSPSPGNPNPALFSFGGISPAPTIRVRADGELRIRVRNLLGLNHGKVPVGHVPDFFDLPPDIARAVCSRAGFPPNGDDPDGGPSCSIPQNLEVAQEVIGYEQRDNWDVGGHVNGVRGAHTTNLHTHGLHVSPDTNPDGSHSDNIFLRILPRADAEARRARNGEDVDLLHDHEHVGQLDYRYVLTYEHEGRRTPHPPGTHWYHPHAHGSTADQVSSGMAGYLIVEGDVDEAVNRALAGESWPDPKTPTGAWDYRERLVFLQRAFTQSFDNSAAPNKRSLRFPPFPSADDAAESPVFSMRPGAVERWRVLNGSVDGAGTKRFMVLEGQFVQRADRIWRVRTEGEGEQARRWLEWVSEEDFEHAKANLHQLSMDGITLVQDTPGGPRHWVKDLSRQNADTRNPLAFRPREGETEIAAWLRAYESVWKNGETLRHAFVRPNELYLTNANRADVFFKAPLDAGGRIYTILAKEAHLHNDNFQQRLQGRSRRKDFVVFRDLFDVVAAYVHVTGDPVEGGEFDPASLTEVLPPVPPLLRPIGEGELQVPAAEARITGAPAGSRRTRTISYSGAGGTNFPLHTVPQAYAERHPELEKLTWSHYDGVRVLLQNLTGTMGINPEFDLSVHPDPAPPRKFAPGDAHRSRVLVNTAEEWVVYNTSMTLWGHTDRQRFRQPGSYNFRYRSYPVHRSEGQRRFAEDSEFRITTKATDHPFHIHINPVWVLRIDVPDENGTLHNVLPEPTWMDTVPIPRNGGRAVFRTRFDDFTGTWIHHCHILLHEDNGMMASVECTDRPQDVNYRPRARCAGPDLSGDEVNAIYPKPSLEVMYRQNLSFVDPSDVGGHEFPGFDFEVPRLEDT